MFTLGYAASESIYAFVGDPVILPCQIKMDGELPTVEWFKIGPPEATAMLYRDSDIFGEKNRAYWDRTHLFLHQLKKGNISLKMWDVRLSDAGTYVCKTISVKSGTKSVTTMCTLELHVGKFI